MTEFDREQEEKAAAEARRIGGDPGDGRYYEDGEEADPAHAPLMEAGEGEAEGFEQSEQELIDHSSHGDMHAARRILEDAPAEEESGGAPGGEADREASSENEDTER